MKAPSRFRHKINAQGTRGTLLARCFSTSAEESGAPQVEYAAVFAPSRSIASTHLPRSGDSNASFRVTKISALANSRSA